MQQTSQVSNFDLALPFCTRDMLFHLAYPDLPCASRKLQTCVWVDQLWSPDVELPCWVVQWVSSSEWLKGNEEKETEIWWKRSKRENRERARESKWEENNSFKIINRAHPFFLKRKKMKAYWTKKMQFQTLTCVYFSFKHAAEMLLHAVHTSWPSLLYEETSAITKRRLPKYFKFVVGILLVGGGSP